MTDQPIFIANISHTDAVFLVRGRVDFETAKKTCANNALGTLARTASESEFEKVLEGLEEGPRILLQFRITRFWIGLEQVNGTGRDSREFSFVDGETEGLDFVQVDVGNFPWRVNEPNNFKGKDENCGE